MKPADTGCTSLTPVIHRVVAEFCLAHPPPRRHCGRVAWALWASWSSAPPRLDPAGQGKHFSVQEQKQQRFSAAEDRGTETLRGSDLKPPADRETHGSSGRGTELARKATNLVASHLSNPPVIRRGAGQIRQGSTRRTVLFPPVSLSNFGHKEAQWPGRGTRGFLCFPLVSTDLVDRGLFCPFRVFVAVSAFVKRLHLSFGAEYLEVEQSPTGKGCEPVLISQMATYSEHNGRNGLIVSMKESFEGKVTKKDCEGKFEAKRPSKDLCHSPSAAESNASGVASFTTNHNSVVCLPLVSEGLKLVWTQSDQTRELDTIPELVQAFNLFPYPSSNEVTTLARVCALPLDKVKVWFMVQRIKYGISWSSEEIEETRRKLAVPELHDDSPETNDEAKIKSKNKISEEMVIEDKIGEEVEVPPTSVTPKKTKPKCESPDSYKPAKPTTPCFSSTLPPPQDSYFYRSPADPPASTATDVSLDLSESSSRQHRHSRYKKSKAQLAALRKSFLRENWPAEAELRRLQEETGLTRNDIRKWFSDSRYQLRVGRGSLAAAQSYSQHTAAGGKHDQQTQPLPLITQKTRQPNSVKATEATRNSGTRSTDFFQTFLTNTLEAFEEKGPEAEECDVMEELSGDGDSVKDEGQSEEQPLQLTKTCKMETEIPQEPADILKSSPHSSPSSSPPPTNKQVSNSCSTSKKSSQPAKASPSPTPVLISGTPSTTSPSPAPALTPGGRPRKTKEQLDVLKQHFLRCQWPKSDDYTELVKLTGLPRADVIQWFGDTRYAVKNGQLRWVKGVRDQFLAELAIQQSGSGLTNGSSSGTSTRVGGSRKRKSQANVPSAGTPDIQPLLAYFLSTGPLHEKDLDTLCKKSKMSYQQVRDWFASQDARETEQEQSITD